VHPHHSEEENCIIIIPLDPLTLASWTLHVSILTGFASW
jgi:hypothetical protein